MNNCLEFKITYKINNPDIIQKNKKNTSELYKFNNDF